MIGKPAQGGQPDRQGRGRLAHDGGVHRAGGPVGLPAVLAQQLGDRGEEGRIDRAVTDRRWRFAVQQIRQPGPVIDPAAGTVHLAVGTDQLHP